MRDTTISRPAILVMAVFCVDDGAVYTEVPMRGRILTHLAIIFVVASSTLVVGMVLGEKRVPAAERVVGILNMDGDPFSAKVGAAPVDFMPYWRVWNTLDRKFIPFSTSTAAAVPLEDRVYSSIEGLVASYKDPYTVFMRPQVAQDFKIATKGSLEGIGALIGERDGDLIVVGPLPGSPAEKANLVAGDRVLDVDGTSTAGLAVDAAVDLIRGPGGTTVTLKVQNEAGETRDVPIVRGTIEIPSTAHAVIARAVPTHPAVSEPGASSPASPSTQPSTSEPSAPVPTEMRDFYLLRLFSFSQSSIDSFERELREFATSGASTLIIDLRGNPGGYLEAAVNIAGWFLPEGTVVVRERSGPEQKEIVHTTRERTIFKDGVPKVAILVDQGTASAAEILAGALQEHGVAKLVGTRTFGKGCVQELVNITDTLALKVTVARWYTPNGVSISEGGLTPDIAVDPAAATSSDPWVDAAIDYLSGNATTIPVQSTASTTLNR
jgi:carboxyl-terminal processing protease